VFEITSLFPFMVVVGFYFSRLTVIRTLV